MLAVGQPARDLAEDIGRKWTTAQMTAEFAVLEFAGPFVVMTGPVSLASDIAAYEAGELDEDQVLDLFQRLLDTGLIHQLQGSYQRTAQP